MQKKKKRERSHSEIAKGARLAFRSILKGHKYGQVTFLVTLNERRITRLQQNVRIVFAVILITVIYSPQQCSFFGTKISQAPKRGRLDSSAK